MAGESDQQLRLRLEGADEVLRDAAASWAELGKALRKGAFSADVPLIYRVVTLHPRWMAALETMKKRSVADGWPARSALRQLYETSERALMDVVTIFGTPDVPAALLARMEGGDAGAWARALQQIDGIDVDRATIFAGELDALLARERWTSADAAGIALLLPALDEVLAAWNAPPVPVGDVAYSQVHTLRRIDQLRRRGWQRAAALVEEKLRGFEPIEHELPALVLLVCVAMESGQVEAQPSNELPPPRAALAAISARLFVARPKDEREWKATSQLARMADASADEADRKLLIDATKTGARTLEQAVFRIWAEP